MTEFYPFGKTVYRDYTDRLVNLDESFTNPSEVDYRTQLPVITILKGIDYNISYSTELLVKIERSLKFLIFIAIICVGYLIFGT